MKRPHTTAEKVGLAVKILPGLPVIIWAILIFLCGILRYFDLPRPGM